MKNLFVDVACNFAVEFVVPGCRVVILTTFALAHQTRWRGEEVKLLGCRTFLEQCLVL